MATWGEVRSYIAGKYVMSNDSGNMITLNIETEGGRSQIIFVGGSEELIFFKSPFAKVGQVNPGQIFENPLLFGVSVVGEFYCLCHVQLAETLDTMEIDVPISLIARFADELEKTLGSSDTF